MGADPHDTETPRRPSIDLEGDRLAPSPRDIPFGTVRPLDGPLDRPGAEAEGDEGMTNEPIPLSEDEPEVSPTRRPDDA
ncbi:hypothetical protein [Methylobacterium sp. J-076]|uniref:hypothetical protein n=1 Tax=Methylobacterium sp. J-076 TaxID=2836655 RepID=UPI001FBB52F1|nr:hypothetical protein [Methylobacterium sp. J-076]MCJ2015432.1 hypothetical protein [Methylobacterium sp. J-076]